MREILRGSLCSGLPVSIGMTAVLAAVLTVIDLPLVWYPAAAAFPLLCGCYAAGYSAGKAAREGGLQHGAAAAFLLSLLWYAAACRISGALRVPVLLLVTLPCGMFGGVCGVNTKQPMPRRRSHRAKRLHEALVLRRKTLHRPKKLSTSAAESDAAGPPAAPLRARR